MPTSGEVSGLTTALASEYRAQATYQQVVADIGSVQPFENLGTAEAQHIDALANLFERRGLTVPAASAGAVAHYSTRGSACEAGLLLEQQMAAQYRSLLSTTTAADVRAVYQNLLSAITDNHIPALSHC